MPIEAVKLSVTHNGNLISKYGSTTAIDQAVARWQENDLARGIRTVHVAVDDGTALALYGIAPPKGVLTAAKVKQVVDKLCQALNPEYLVLLGAGDVIPHFEVPNPTLHQTGDRDANVPTDNPYACSRSFVENERASYLIPDRVVGRLPDFPDATDPAVLIEMLDFASNWRARIVSDYSNDLLATCSAWLASGKTCVAAIGRSPDLLLASPPEEATSAGVQSRLGGLLHMIKAHGNTHSGSFWGQLGDNFPVLLTSRGMDGQIRQDTIVAAMCCFGAAVFNPADPAVSPAGAMPIPMAYLSQGAFGFCGSTNTAWVGIGTMQCADWIVTGFLKSVLGGASIGRALLEAKQEFVAWIQKQGRSPDLMDEKSLVQFVLLGDPSIHPVISPQSAAASAAPVAATAGTDVFQISPVVNQERFARRAYRAQMGRRLRLALPNRQAVSLAATPAAAAVEIATMLTMDQQSGPSRSLDLSAEDVAPLLGGDNKLKFDFSDARVDRVSSKVRAPTTLSTAALPEGVQDPKVTDEGPIEILEYYWSARREVGPATEIQIVHVAADNDGKILRTKVVASS